MSVSWRSSLTKYKSHIFLFLIILLTLKVIIPQLDDLRESIAALNGANLYWILLGIIVFFFSIPLASFQYMALALRPLEFALTFRVETAALFISKLLPQSVGTISLNVYYLMKKAHSASQAAAVMTMDGISSGVAYTILMIIGFSVSSLSLSGLKGTINISTNLILFAVILLLGITYTAFRSRRIRDRIKNVWSDLKKNFASYKQKPMSVVTAGVCNGLSSLTSIFALWASAHALGIGLSFSGALLAYTFGNIAATLIPTPGGIGAVEAGIYSGLVLVGIDGPDATLITLLYRLITYWIPILPGYYAFRSLRKSLLSSYKIKRSAA